MSDIEFRRRSLRASLDLAEARVRTAQAEMRAAALEVEYLATELNNLNETDDKIAENHLG